MKKEEKKENAGSIMIFFCPHHCVDKYFCNRVTRVHPGKLLPLYSPAVMLLFMFYSRHDVLPTMLYLSQSN